MKKCENPECKKLFEPNDYRHKYCNQKCTNRMAYLKKIERLPQKACIRCGASFRTRREEQVKCGHCQKAEGMTTGYIDREIAHPLVALRNKFLLMPI